MWSMCLEHPGRPEKAAKRVGGAHAHLLVKGECLLHAAQGVVRPCQDGQRLALELQAWRMLVHNLGRLQRLQRESRKSGAQGEPLPTLPPQPLQCMPKEVLSAAGNLPTGFELLDNQASLTFSAYPWRKQKCASSSSTKGFSGSCSNACASSCEPSRTPCNTVRAGKALARNLQTGDNHTERGSAELPPSLLQSPKLNHSATMQAESPCFASIAPPRCC